MWAKCIGYTKISLIGWISKLDLLFYGIRYRNLWQVKRGGMTSVDIIEERDPYKQFLKIVAGLMAFVFVIIFVKVLKSI